MDISLYSIGFFPSFLLTLLALFGRLKGVAALILGGITSIGGFVGIYFFLGLASDGSLSEISNGSTIPIASATLNASTWAFVLYLPLGLILMSFVAALYRAIQ